jgi:hypothetical protein
MTAWMDWWMQGLLEIKQAMSRGMFRMIAALEREGFYYVQPLLQVVQSSDT